MYCYTITLLKSNSAQRAGVRLAPSPVAPHGWGRFTHPVFPLGGRGRSVIAFRRDGGPLTGDAHGATTNDSKQPTHDALWVEGEGRNKVWHNLGAAWPHDDGEGFTVQLKTRPFRDADWDGRIVLRKRRPKPEGEPA